MHFIDARGLERVSHLQNDGDRGGGDVLQQATSAMYSGVISNVVPGVVRGIVGTGSSFDLSPTDLQSLIERHDNTPNVQPLPVHCPSCTSIDYHTALISVRS